MGWTHDYSDAVRTRRSVNGPGSRHGDARRLTQFGPRVGIPRILRRRARWVSVRLRHPRG
ncbi:hypothetical protein [Streptomyces sp. NPDC046985]|uniref:hypothetical protein n=1 Tax=Streptomyces sp. NPDC046985 TaxID=3155377 RepID=UPI0033DCD999